MFTTPPRVEVLRPDRFANVDLAGTVVLAIGLGGLAWIFLISAYIRFRLNRQRVEGLVLMSALVALQFAVRSGGFHLIAAGSGVSLEGAANFLIEVAVFPLALFAVRQAQPQTGWNEARWATIYLISWGVLASAVMFSLVPAAWAPFGFHMLFFVMGLSLWSQIQSPHAPLHYLFLVMSAVEGVLAVGVLSGNGWSWGPWLGAYFEMVLLVWALVRVVNSGFVEALKLAAEKHEFETLKHRAYTSGLEEEKKRIAGELHDDVLGSLVLVTHSMPLNNPFRSTLQHVIAKTRRLTMNLSPHGVAEMPLSDAIERLAKSYRSDELSVWFHLHAAPEALPESSHFELFRMAQEVLQNIYKHANANRVDISLDWDPTEGQLLLTIEDNGIGFDPDAVMKRSTGLGLANLKSRAESIGALLTIESSPGSGSYISIEWVND
jgi:signal transduction histidine kinase